MRTFSLAVAVCATLAVAVAPANAAAKSCSRKATTTAGTVVDLTRATQAEDGGWQLPEQTVKHLDAISVYAATSDVTVSYAKVTYRFEQGAIFMLSCFGHSRAEGAKYPSITLASGSVTAKFAAGKPGAVSSPEGLWDPYASKAMTMTVTRAAKGAPTLDDVLANGLDALNFGTVKVKKTAGAGYLNVTPYVGAKPGVCRQALGGTFVSTRLQKGQIKGTSTFVGLTRR